MRQELKQMLANVEQTKIPICELDETSMQWMRRIRNEEEAVNAAAQKLIKNFDAIKQQLFQSILRHHMVLVAPGKAYGMDYIAEQDKCILYEIKHAVPTEQLPMQEPSNEDPVQELPPK